MIDILITKSYIVVIAALNIVEEKQNFVDYIKLQVVHIMHQLQDDDYSYSLSCQN